MVVKAHFSPICYLACIFLILIGSIVPVRSQSIDTTTSRLWTSLSFMTIGVITNQSPLKENLQSDLINTFGSTESNIDDYISYIPTLQVLGHKLSKGDKHQYHFEQYLISTGSCLIVTYGLKFLLNQKRPNGGSLAFPSGHTSFAFSTATVNFQILKKDFPFWAYMSYLPAAATGMFRIMRNKHWHSDVLFGAGLGILSTQLSYRLRPNKLTNYANKNSSTLHFGTNVNGISLSLRF